VGNFGFDFDSGGASKLYILCAVVAQNSELSNLHETVSKVKNNNGFKNTEMKSRAVGNTYRRRSKILSELLPINFRVILFVADKQKFIEGSPLSSYRQSFIKFLHQRLYDALYRTYPKLRIIEDQIGTAEVQASFKRYVREHRPQNLFNEYDFDYTDSKDSLFVQLADFVGGTISKAYTDDASPNYLEILKGKLSASSNFPTNVHPTLALHPKKSENMTRISLTFQSIEPGLLSPRMSKMIP
jgi:hypothetical protein